MKIAVVGAGVAGLAALRHCLEQNHECLAFEQTGNVGGTWNYTDAVDLDEYGLPVRSSMYQGLVTNLPKELMEFEDYHYEEKDRSFIPQVDVLEYINTFADHFKLRQHIKFFKHVVEVDVVEKNKWKVKVKDLKSGKVEEFNFDAVMICIGNYSVPKAPGVIPGLEHFKGHFIHSHYYRKSDKYKGKVVLVIGGGPSGVDISRILESIAQKVFLSSSIEPAFPVKQNVVNKFRVTSFDRGIAHFEDGTSERIDEIIFCTGKIRIGFPAEKFHKSKEEMMDDINKDMEKRKNMGFPLRHAHKLGKEQGAYLDELSDIAGLAKMPPVLQKLYEYHRGRKNLQTRYFIEL